MDKRKLSETDIISKFILPAFQTAGWDDITQIRQEVKLRDGKVIVRGQLGVRKTVKSADIVFYHKPSVSAVTWGVFNPEENKELPPHLDPRIEHEVQSGDLLISRANTADLVAKAVVVPDLAPKNLMISDKIIRFKLHESVNGEYFNLMNNSQVSRDYYNRVADGTSSSMKNVSREQIRSLVVAPPPQDEQHSIVAKVDELMTLCDQLKARLTDAQTTKLHLTDAIVEQAL